MKFPSCRPLSNGIALTLLFFSPLYPGVLQAQNAPVVLQPIPAVNVPKGEKTVNIDLSKSFGLKDMIGALPAIPGSIARFQVAGRLMHVELFPEVAPKTVANFRKYLRAKAYNGTFIHRAVPNFVIQGGGYMINEPRIHIETFGNVQNEFQRSNLTGTIAMAKLSGDINSATSEWFFNLVDNKSLDAEGQRFTVFGKLLGSGLATATDVTELPIVDLGEALNECPLLRYTEGEQILISDLLELETLKEIPFLPSSGTKGGYLRLVPTVADTTLVSATISGSNLKITSKGDSTGSTTVTVKAVDPDGQKTSTSFKVHVINSNLPVVALTVQNPMGKEGAANASFLLSRTGGTDNPITVKVAYSGSAVNGADYAQLSSTLRIPVGENETLVLLNPLDDARVEGLETAKVTLVSDSGYVLDPNQSSVELSMIDADSPEVTVSAIDDAASEPTSDTARLRFTRTGSTASSLSVPFTLGGNAILNTDYTIDALPALISAGQSSVVVTITARDDSAAEGLETIDVTLNPSKTYNALPPSARVNLFDNELPIVSLTAPDPAASEPGTNLGKIKVTRTGATTFPLTVFLTFAGSATVGQDYATPPRAVTIPAGQTSAGLRLKALDDAKNESQEVIEVNLTPSNLYNAKPGTLSVVIQDDD